MTIHDGSDLYPRVFLAALSALIACGAMASVWVVNGSPLFYFDTIGYAEQGRAALALVWPAAPDAASTGPLADTTTASSDTDLGVAGDRSILYALLLGLVDRVWALSGMVFLNILLSLAVCVAAVQTLVAHHDAPSQTARLLIVAVLLACLGSLPFYTASLMPDIATPLMLLGLAVLVTASRELSWVYWLLLVLGLAAAGFLHLSNLGILVAMLPVFVGLAAFRVTSWAPVTVLLAALLLVFLAMQSYALLVRAMAPAPLVSASTESGPRAEPQRVVYRPFLTARLIHDGPGYAYLAETCPSASPPRAACALHATLAANPKPQRFLSWNILFRDDELGSLRLLPAETQQAIADNQFEFALAVATARPLHTAQAMLGNVLDQLTRVRIDMTLPTPSMAEFVSPNLSEQLTLGRLSAPPPPGWPETLAQAHYILYGLSTALLLGFLLHPRTPRPMRLFISMILLGVVANAAVCGIASTPADRYGARVAWLLPFTASLAVLLRDRRSGGTIRTT